MVTDNQKKLIKRVVIKPSTMSVVQNKADLERIRKELALILNIQVQDVTFTFVEICKQ